tara:strand:- start:40 stop:168 length:129 start_codon:yes stop_codon:yes gene_type:complete
LTKDLESGAAILRKFVEKEDSIMSERDFAGARVSPAAEEADI